MKVLVNKSSGEIYYHNAINADVSYYATIDLPANLEDCYQYYRYNFTTQTFFVHESAVASIEAIRTLRVANLLTAYDTVVGNVATKFYPESEQVAFTRKLLAAQAWAALSNTEKDDETATYLANTGASFSQFLILFDECSLTPGISIALNVAVVDQLVELIRLKDLQFCRLIGCMTKDRKRMMTEINAAPSTVVGVQSLLEYQMVWSMAA